MFFPLVGDVCVLPAKSPAEEGRICFVFAKKFARLAFSGCPSIVPIASLCCFRLPLRLSRLSLRLLRVSYSVFPDWPRPEEVAPRRMKNAPLCMCRAAHNCYQLSAEYSCPRRVVSVAYNAQRCVIVSGLQLCRRPRRNRVASSTNGPAGTGLYPLRCGPVRIGVQPQSASPTT